MFGPSGRARRQDLPDSSVREVLELASAGGQSVRLYTALDRFGSERPFLAGTPYPTVERFPTDCPLTPARPAIAMCSRFFGGPAGHTPKVVTLVGRVASGTSNVRVVRPARATLASAVGNGWFMATLPFKPGAVTLEALRDGNVLGRDTLRL